MTDGETGPDQGPEAAGTTGAPGLEKIEHIVVLMMENHSFDNYLGTLGHGDGLTREPDGSWGPANPAADGTSVRPHHLASTVQQSGNPTQSWHASHIQYAEGTNRGFVASIEQTIPGADATVPMGFWDEGDLPFYSDLARTFALADRWHCSVLGPTFPNRRFLIAGTANGLIDDVFAGMLDRPRGGTIFELLGRHGVSWRNYHHVSPLGLLAKRLLGSAGLRLAHTAQLLSGAVFKRFVRTGLDNLQFTADIYPLSLRACIGHLSPIRKFFSDAADGKLPQFCIVDPDFQTTSEENPKDVRTGEGFASAVINAVMAGPHWDRTLLIWLYDEHGGYFDHVAPPPAIEPDGVRPRSLLDSGNRMRWVLQHLGKWQKLQNADSGSGRYDRLGFRVPAVVVSPYSKPGYVSSTVYDHTSILKLVEMRWGLPSLTARDAAATAPLDLLDFDNPTFLQPPVLAAPAQAWDRSAG